MKKQLTLLEQAQLEERKVQLNRLQKAENCGETLKLLSVLLPHYKPQPKQAKFHASRAHEKGLKGGYGSGKTIALCAEAIALAYINRPIAIIISSPTEDVIEETTLRTLEELCTTNQIPYEWQVTKNRFRIFFGEKKSDHGIIYLIGQKFMKGPSVAAVGFDEPFSQASQTYDNLIARVRHRKAKHLEIFWSGTAEPEIMEWGMEYFEGDSDTEELFTVTISTRENKHLPEKYVATLESKYDAKKQEVYIEGKHVLLTSNPVYHAFDRRKNAALCEDIRHPMQQELIIGVDFNVDPMTAVLLGFADGIYYQEREFVLHSSNTEELCGAIIAHLRLRGIPDRSIILTGDATGRKRGTRGNLSDFEIIRDAFMRAEIPISFHVPSENPAVRDRVNHINKLFESGRFIIDPHCDKSIKDRELVSWKQSGEGFIIDKSKKDLTHLSDAADYAVFNTRVLIEQDETNGGMVQVLQRRRR